MPADLPAALVRAAAQQQQHQALPTAASGTAEGSNPSPLLPTEQGSLGASQLAGPLTDAGLTGRGGQRAAAISNTLRFGAQYPGVLGQMAPPPRPMSAPLPPSVAGLRALDALAANLPAGTNITGPMDAQQLLALQAQAQLGAGAGTPFQARLVPRNVPCCRC